MKGVGIVLIEYLRGIQLVKIIHGIIISLSAVVIDIPVEVHGKGPVRFFEFMTEGEIGAVDIEAALGAGGMAVGAADGRIVLVRGGRDGGCIGPGRLEAEVRAEDKRIVAVYLLFQVEKDALVLGPGITL